MANTDAPFGLKPIRHASGAPYNGACRAYYIAGDDSALFVVDPVVITGESNTSEFRGYPEATLAEVTKATAGATNNITGVIVGFDVDPDSLTTQYNPANNARIAYVADDPDLTYIIQDDGGGAFTNAIVGLNAVLIYTTSGSTVTGRSGVELDGGTSTAPAADATYQLTIEGLHNVPGNVVADYAIWEVRINTHGRADDQVGA